MKVFAVSQNNTTLYLESLEFLDNFIPFISIEDLEVGDKWTIEIVELSEEEFQDLEDFDGF